MKLTRSLFNFASFLMFSSILAVPTHAQGHAGGVSSTVTNPPPPNQPAAAPASTGSKPLPWKFLASPMGALYSSSDNDIDALAKCSDPKVDVSANVANLLTATIGATAAAKLEAQKAQYVIIHVVDPKSGPSGTDAWYLYRSAKGNFADPKWDCQKFTGQRIYGAPSVLFLFLHRHLKAVSLTDAREQLRAQLAAAQTDPLKKFQASNPPDDALAAALKANALTIDPTTNPPTVVPLKDTASGDQFTWLGDENGVPDKLTEFHYESAVVKRVAANTANLKSILGLLFPNAQGKNESTLYITSTEATLWGVGVIRNVVPPSDISIAGYATATSPEPDANRSKDQIGSIGAYNDEQLYWWDASIGIPVTKINDLQYSDSSGTVVATQVSKQSAYAMFNLMIHPVDLSSSSDSYKDNWWPRLLAGFPLASSPWDKLFAGGAIGIPLKPVKDFQFFAGATFINSSKPSTLTAGLTATLAQLENNLKQSTTPKFMFGINVPVKSVIDKLK